VAVVARVQRRASEGIFLAVSALLFAAALRGRFFRAIHVDDGRDGDARRVDDSMAWMRMPGQTWTCRGVFLGTWVVMMVAMMMPSLVPMLWRYRQAVGVAAAVGARFVL
jgi:predicted metal-binding membrane protein